MKQTVPPGKQLVTINLDETYVGYYQGLFKGNLAVTKKSWPITQKPLSQPASRSQLRTGLTHVGLLCDVPCVQRLLPQVLIAADKVLPMTVWRAVVPLLPSWMYIIRMPSKWVTVDCLIWILNLIAWSLRAVKHLYDIVLQMDVLAQHYSMRHMPLVLDGPTQTFKTTAAKTFALNIDNYLELNCSNLSHEPNLRSVRFGTEVINFDELKANTFIENKKVFQGAIGQTTLGENTAAGAQAYTRRLNGIKMIICSNHFKRDVGTLTEEDQDYVWKNIFYLELAPGETMFEDPNPVDTGDALSLDFLRMYVGVCEVCVYVCVSSVLWFFVLKTYAWVDVLFVLEVFFDFCLVVNLLRFRVL